MGVLSDEDFGDGGALAADYDATVVGGIDAAAVGGVVFDGLSGVVEFWPDVVGQLLDAALASHG